MSKEEVTHDQSTDTENETNDDVVGISQVNLYDDANSDFNECEEELFDKADAESIEQQESPCESQVAEQEQLDLDLDLSDLFEDPAVEIANPAAPSHPTDIVPDGLERVPRERPVGMTRSTLNREVFQVGEVGELHFYHTTGAIHAFCKNRNCTHQSNCRKSGTTCPVRRGSGRPVGLLVSWLLKADDYPSKWEHVHACHPTLLERQAARRYFQTLPNAESFLKREKKKARASDPDEPMAV